MTVEDDILGGERHGKVAQREILSAGFPPVAFGSEEEPANERDKKMTAKELQGC